MNRMTARLICAALAGALALSAAGCGKKKESADSAQGAAGGSGVIRGGLLDLEKTKTI